ncbi:hypothetical protein ACEPAI_1800 [Sanghuangporus weigelae]
MSVNLPNPPANTEGISVQSGEPAGDDVIKPQDREEVYSIEFYDVEVSIAGSELASKPAFFSDWAAGVELFTAFSAGESVLSEIERIRTAVKYPEALKSVETTIDIQEPNMENFVVSVRAWSNNPSIPWDVSSNDPRLWEYLLNNWSYAKNAVSKNLNEATQRELADAMLHLIFYQSVKEPGERYEIVFQIKIGTTLVTEGVSKVAITHCLMQPPETLQLGAFALEAKRVDAATAVRQLKLDFCSMQYQRRMLSLKDKTVYGATFVGGKFKLYASKWIGERLACMPVHECTWDIADPVQFVGCLYFLLAMKRHLDKSFEDDFDSFDVERLKASIQKRSEWRDESGSKRSRKDQGSESASKTSRSDKRGSKKGGQDAEAGSDRDVESGCGDDTSYARRPIIMQDFITHMPYIWDQLIKFVRVENWQKGIASSEHMMMLKSMESSWS